VKYANFCLVLCPGVAKISIFAPEISEVIGLMFTIFFTQYNVVRAAVNTCIPVEILQFVVERESKSKRGQCRPRGLQTAPINNSLP